MKEERVEWSAAQEAGGGQEVVAQAQEALLARIVTGVYPALARLPSERELALELACSRSSVREVLGRLDAWGMLETRRGSGAVVRPAREWSLEVLPAWLRYGESSATWVSDLLAIRRSLIVEMVRRVAPRLRGRSLRGARAAVERAWEVRGAPGAFVRADLEIIRELAVEGGLLPGLWALNSVAGVYLELAVWVTASFEVPEGYRDAYADLLTLIEAGRGEEATAALGAWLDRHDRALLLMLGWEP